MKRLPLPAPAPGWLVLLCLIALGAAPVRAQSTNPGPAAEPAAERAVNPYGSGMGLSLMLTNSGFGIGGYYQRAFSRTSSFFAEASLSAGKDEREWRLFSYYGYGRSEIPYKANYLLMLPVNLGVQRRLFQESIRDNFRPYMQLTAGPSFGWTWPYFEDANGNGVYERDERVYDSIAAIPKGSPRFGLGGGIAFGAFFGSSRKVTQGIRLGYSFSYFFEDVQLLTNKPPQHFFGTPTISLIFGKLW